MLAKRREQRAETAEKATETISERIPLAIENGRINDEDAQTAERFRAESSTSFATSSGRGSTLSAASDSDDEMWPSPPDEAIAEYIQYHLKNLKGGSICSDCSDVTLTEQQNERQQNSLKKVKFDFDMSTL